MKQQKPILHARDHLPGGADPLPLVPPSPPYAELILARGPVGFWPLDDGGGDFQNLAVGGGAGDMEPTSTPPPATGMPDPEYKLTRKSLDRFGEDGAIELSNDWAVYPDDPAIERSWIGTTPGMSFLDRAPFAVEFWMSDMQPPDPAAHPYDHHRALVSYNDGSLGDGMRGWWVWLTPDRKIEFYRSSGAAVDHVTAVPTICSHTGTGWDHVAASYDGSTMRLFVNGENVGETPSTLSIPYVGLFRAGMQEYDVAVSGHRIFAHGSIDDVALYDSALDPAAWLESYSGLPAAVNDVLITNANVHPDARIAESKIRGGGQATVLYTPDWCEPPEWVPATSLGGADLVYNGAFPAASPYTDGDIVVGSDGVVYLCVRPTSAAPTPWPGGGGGDGGSTGGGSIPVAATVAALNALFPSGPTDDSLGVIVVGDAPIHVRYDASLGKWVSALILNEQILKGDGLDTPSYNSTVYAFNVAASHFSQSPFSRPWVPWREYDAAGLQWQFRLGAIIRNNSSTGDSYLAVGVIPVDFDGTSAAANGVMTNAEIGPSTGPTARFKRSGWGVVPGATTLRDYLTLHVLAKTAGTASPAVIVSAVPAPFIEGRLVSK